MTPQIPKTRRPRPFLRDPRGFTGAEKALLICVALAMVLLVGNLIRGGSEKAAGDANRVLASQSGQAGPMGSVVAAMPVGAEATPTPPNQAPTATPTPVPAPTPAPSVNTGLGADVDKLAAQSPTMVANIEAMQRAGWTVTYGAAGGGSYADKNNKSITLDGNLKGNTASTLQTLAHESGHALYSADPYVQPTGLTRDQYIKANVNSALKDEGEATLTNLQIRAELLKAGGPDIGVAGAQSDQYKKLFEKWDGKDRDAMRQKIGEVFAKGERPSTDPSKTYWDYYAKTYEDFWDQNVAPTRSKP